MNYFTLIHQSSHQFFLLLLSSCFQFTLRWNFFAVPMTQHKTTLLTVDMMINQHPQSKWHHHQPKACEPVKLSWTYHSSYGSLGQLFRPNSGPHYCLVRSKPCSASLSCQRGECKEPLSATAPHKTSSCRLGPAANARVICMAVYMCEVLDIYRGFLVVCTSLLFWFYHDY